MKFFASHSKILENLGNAAKEVEHKLHLDAIAKKIEAYGGKVLEVTRFNVAAEMAEHRLIQLFDIAIDETSAFIGYVDVKLHALKDHIDHIEVCPPDHGSGS